MEMNLESRKVEIQIAGTPLPATEGETLVHALWAAGMGDRIKVGCVGGVCGACTVSIQFEDGRPVKTDLACMRPVEAGMRVFPFPVDSIPPVAPHSKPDGDSLRAAFPTLQRCTKCGACTQSCPMSIPVMDSILRMQGGRLDEVAEDFTACIHCGLCRAVCEDRVKPHNMGMWVRRSIGMGSEWPQTDLAGPVSGSPSVEAEWDYLMSGDAGERLKRCRAYRQSGEIPQ